MAVTSTRWQFRDFVLTIVVEHHRLITVAIDRGEPIGVGIVTQGFGQLLFTCPNCGTWRRSLYVKDGVLGCRGRTCLRLDYSSRHTHRNGVARLVHLARKVRHRLGASLEPFSDLPPPPCHHGTRKVYDRLVAELAVLEQGAMSALGETLAAVERRARGRKRTRT